GAQPGIPLVIFPIVRLVHVAPFKLAPSHTSPISTMPLPQVVIWGLLPEPLLSEPHAPTAPATTVEAASTMIGNRMFMSISSGRNTPYGSGRVGANREPRPCGRVRYWPVLH